MVRGAKAISGWLFNDMLPLRLAILNVVIIGTPLSVIIGLYFAPWVSIWANEPNDHSLWRDQIVCGLLFWLVFMLPHMALGNALDSHTERVKYRLVVGSWLLATIATAVGTGIAIYAYITGNAQSAGKIAIGAAVVGIALKVGTLLLAKVIIPFLVALPVFLLKKVAGWKLDDWHEQRKHQKR